ncbi:MAG: hypothetical protein JWM59_4156 [Verrucomicrobiales bacterium]|nr:hypothetical protein [Verrucomicrobiales bacterium]
MSVNAFPAADALLQKVSVVVPVLNCLKLVTDGMADMRRWAPLVKEVVVVDSHSTDGTLEFLRENLPWPHVQFHQRPRGLYAAWNHGIRHCTGDWIHISTAGDTISLEDLHYLAGMAERHQPDVITAPPRFVCGETEHPAHLRWPIHQLLERHPEGEVILLEGLSLMAFAMEFCRLCTVIQSWLGSSASNLYRRGIFETMPFPEDGAQTGDVMHGLRYAHQLRAAFVRRECGRFIFHDSVIPRLNVLEHFGEMYAAEYSIQQARLRELLFGFLRSGPLRHRLHPVAETSLITALAHSPLESLTGVRKLTAELEKQALKRGVLQQKVNTLRGERDEWKSRARLAETALKRYRGRIPSFLRSVLGLESPAASRQQPAKP